MHHAQTFNCVGLINYGGKTHGRRRSEALQILLFIDRECAVKNAVTAKNLVPSVLQNPISLYYWISV